jgi:hypothetical protein
MAQLNFVTKALTTTNSVRIKLYKEPDRITVVDQLTFAAPHPQRNWTFHDIIPGVNYFFRWTEIDGSGNDIQTYASSTVTADANNISLRDPENIIVGLTPNVVPGATTALLDGSNGSPDYRGEEIIPFLTGYAAMYEGFEYSWNSTTGLLTLMNGQEFYQDVRYFIYFKPKQANNSSNVVIRDAWTTDLIVTDDITLTIADLNKNIIIKGNDGYLKITLPDINITPKGLFHFDSTDGAHKCVEIVCSSVTGNVNKISYPGPGRGSLFMGRNETISIYRDSNSPNVWRAKYPDGNFKTVGEFIGEYTEADDVINKVALNADLYDVLEYARLYDYILRLPSGQVVPFDSWQVGNNAYKFSTANSDGKFHVPTLLNLYERASGTDTPGTYQDDMVGPHTHPVRFVMNGTDGTPNGQHLDPSSASVENNTKGTNSYAILQNTFATETRPKTYVANKYIRC